MVVREMFPFKERVVKNRLLREFSKETDPEDLIWHRDRSDRKITVIEGENWLLQIDNTIPVIMESGQSYQIPKNTYHRVIKGSSDLIVEIQDTSARPGELGIAAQTGGVSAARQDIQDEIENTTSQINSLSSSIEDQQKKKVLQDKLRILQKQNSST